MIQISLFIFVPTNKTKRTMKLYNAPKLKELYRSLMSTGRYNQASRIFRFMKTGDKKYINCVLDDYLMDALKRIGINPISVAFDSIHFQR